LFIAAALASAFSGLIAFAVLSMDGVSGYPGWRWLYIIEGAATLLVAIVCYFAIPSSYTTAYFLDDEEKAIMRRRAEQTEAYSGGKGHYSKADFMMAVRDVKTWLHAAAQVMCLTITYGFGIFLPIILRFGFNFSVAQSQYLSIPVFLWGSIVYAICGHLSDRYSRRFLIVILCSPVGMIGYAILLANDNVVVGVRYFACFLVATCAWMMGGGNLAWFSTNTAPDGKRAASLGLGLSIGNLGGIISGQIYPQSHAPGYRLGHAWSLGAICVSFCLWWMLRQIYYSREEVKDEMREGKIPEPTVFSDQAPSYRYQH
jgi:MFS family permease